ncbi:hypothetical protein EUGRSUZ_F01960 [Eucalyptus grandis]|uniref:Uncharacterized protein n=2 Tax=Eucalyptus grandis TaxID=71139 RepID=A0ACC3KGL6_EUCGR|nr:hypothetical protein EUGRSUZ_F01960 [Eucalyptus grandis]
MSNLVKKMWCCGAKSFASVDAEEAAVPEGHVRVYVGKDAPCKFEMEANYLNHPLFENLLRLSEEEFGYSYDGALRIACEVDLFQYLVHLLRPATPPRITWSFPTSSPSSTPVITPATPRTPDTCLIALDESRPHSFFRVPEHHSFRVLKEMGACLWILYGSSPSPPLSCREREIIFGRRTACNARATWA